MPIHPILSLQRILISAIFSLGISFAADGDDWPETLPFEVEKSPLLSPQEMLKSFVVADGWEMKLVAAEPLIEKPVLAEYDTMGRLWVAEMVSYMLDENAADEKSAISTVKRLEDTDGDGQMDKATVVVKDLVLPRILAFDAVGLITTDGKALVRYPLDNDGNVSGERTVLDPEYASGKNVEHEPNGFIPGIDNFRYNSKAAKSYTSSSYELQNTAFRGQWGIHQTDDGMLIHNNNSILGVIDTVYPGTANARPKIKARGTEQSVRIGANNIQPLRHSRGTNRAYKWVNKKWVGTLKDDILKSPTSASGITFYDAAAMPDGYGSTIAVSCPASNLVALRSWQPDDSPAKARNPLGEASVVATKDERFRPVSTFTTPDGAIGIVDMSHGIVQHDIFLTGYLRNYYLQSGLAGPPRGYGRIWKAVPKQRTSLPETPTWPATASQNQLVEMLHHPLQWWRIQAQYKLASIPAEKLNPENTTALRTIIENAAKSDERTHAVAAIHALWTLDAMNAINGEELDAACAANHTILRAHGFRVAAANPQVSRSALPAIIEASPTSLAETTARWHALVSIPFPAAANAIAHDAKDSESDKTKQFWLHAAALTSTTKGASQALIEATADTSLAAVLKDKPVVEPEEGAHLTGASAEQFNHGKDHYTIHCASCHGDDGGGMEMLAPPLDGSEWVTGSKHQLAAILLQGLNGPVIVAGQKYDLPAAMPALRDSRAINDQQIADIMTYIRNAWTNSASPVDTKAVTLIRSDRNEAERLSQGVLDNQQLEYTAADSAPTDNSATKAIPMERTTTSDGSLALLIGLAAASLFTITLFKAL